MKNFLKIILLTTTILTLYSTSILATNISTDANIISHNISNSNINVDRAYQQKAKLIRSEINMYTAKIKELNEYIATVKSKLKTLDEQYKTNKNSVSSDIMKQIKNLRKSIQKNEKKEKIINEDDSIKILVQNKEYDKAIEKLKQILEAKKEQLKITEEKNAVWHQIDALIR